MDFCHADYIFNLKGSLSLTDRKKPKLILVSMIKIDGWIQDQLSCKWLKSDLCAFSDFNFIQNNPEIAVPCYFNNVFLSKNEIVAKSYNLKSLEFIFEKQLGV